MEVSQRTPKLYNAYDKMIRSTYKYYKKYNDYISLTELQMIFEQIRIEQVTPNMLLCSPSNYLIRMKKYIMTLEGYTMRWLIYRLKKSNKNNTDINNYIKSVEMKGIPKIPNQIDLFKSYVMDPISRKLYSFESDVFFIEHNN